MWEAKVIVAAAAAEMNWKHEVTPDWGDLTHWGRVTHICVGKLTIIGSENDLSPSRRQAINWTNDGLLSIGTLRTYFSEILIKIQKFSLKKMLLKMSSGKRRLCCLGPNELMRNPSIIQHHKCISTTVSEIMKFRLNDLIYLICLIFTKIIWVSIT